MNSDNTYKQGWLKERYIKERATLINPEWAKGLAEWVGKRKCLEIWAGYGALSYLLQREGVNIIPTDTNTDSLFAPVETIDTIEAIKKYGQDIDILIITWPPFNDEKPYMAIKELHGINPNALIIYLGEPGGRCDASDMFFNHFVTINDTEFHETVVKKYKMLADFMTEGPYLGVYTETVNPQYWTYKIKAEKLKEEARWHEKEVEILKRKLSNMEDSFSKLKENISIIEDATITSCRELREALDDILNSA